MDTFEREMRGLRGDQKVSELAVKSSQNQMAEMLKNGMGQDMMSVLNGDKTVELPKSEVRKFKLKNWFKKLLRKF